MPLADVDARVIRVVDVKTPGSGEERRNRYEDLALLRPEEQIKFVICDRADYEWSREQGRSARPRRALPGVVLAQRRAIAGARSSPTGSSRTGCRCASSSSFTRCSGAMSRESEPHELTRAVVLLSGGLDSATVLALARAAGPRVLRVVGVLRPAPRRRSSTPRRASRSASARASIASCTWISRASAARRSPTHRIAVPTTAERGHSDHLRSRAQHHHVVAGAGLGRSAEGRRDPHRRERGGLFRLSRLPSGVRRRLRAARARSRPRREWRARRCAFTRRSSI